MNEVKSYNRESLDKLKLWLQKAKEKGFTKYYEILVDGKRVTYKTENLEEFDNYLHWMDELAQSLRVMVYNTQNSHRAQVFEYRTENYIEGESNLLYHTRSRKLSEVEIEERANALFNEQQKEREQIELAKQNAELLKRVADAEQYIDKLERELNNSKENGTSSLAKTIEELAGKFLGATHLNKVPTEDTGSVDGTNAANNEEEPMTCSFKRKTQGESSENINFNDLEKQELEILRLAKQSLGKEKYVKVCAVFDFLVKNPACIKTVHESVIGLAEG